MIASHYDKSLFNGPISVTVSHFPLLSSGLNSMIITLAIVIHMFGPSQKLILGSIIVLGRCEMTSESFFAPPSQRFSTQIFKSSLNHYRVALPESLCACDVLFFFFLPSGKTLWLPYSDWVRRLSYSSLDWTEMKRHIFVEFVCVWQCCNHSCFII